MSETILIAEDDPAILTGLSDVLKLEGYDVLETPNGRAALEFYRSSRPDLVLLDVMMPEMNGYDVCRAIRREDERTPILMLTAKGEEIDKVVGLELGADDYIVKPFGIAELTARIRSALRRSSQGKKTLCEPTLRIGSITVDFDAMNVRRDSGETYPLTPKENELLKYFAVHPGKVISRETLLEAIWGIDPDSDITTRSVDTHVARLRQKIEENPSEPKLLITAHGAGYRFR
ncbi:MAG: response regulator transcription factor [Synergistaceae bacterium]|nr:response regulator transcription factor [Synergistaceae bacterium]